MTTPQATAEVVLTAFTAVHRREQEDILERMAQRPAAIGQPVGDSSRRLRPATASAIPPRTSVPATRSRHDRLSPIRSTPPAAAMGGTES